MANNQLLASDNFASGSLAAGWSQYFAATHLGTVVAGSPNTVQPGTLNAACGQIWTGLTWPRDQISEVTMNAMTSSTTDFLSLIVRADQSGKNGYQVNLVNGTATIYRADNNSFTSLHSVSGLTFAAGDVWSFGAIGALLVLYQNGKYITSWPDATYTTGAPGFNEQVNTGGTLSQVQVSSWRGYNAIAQDGVWQKQGVILEPIASDINTGATSLNSGTNDFWVLPNESGIVLSGTVFAGWYWSQSGINYVESKDGKSWTRYASNPVIATGSYAKVLHVGSTYYLYCQTNASAETIGIKVYTSTDRVSWSLRSSTVIVPGTVGAWDASGLYLFSPFYYNGTFYALYSGLNASGLWALGLATSADGITWTKSGSNPVYNAGAGTFSESPILVESTWYVWVPIVPAGEVASANPTQSARLKSTNLTSWSLDCVSVRMTELAEGVNTTLGAAYPNCVVVIGGKVYLYYNQTNQNEVSSSGGLWQISLAIAPASSIAALVQFPEDAVQQTANDTFQRGSLGSNWTIPTGASALQIASNKLEPSATGVRCFAAYTAGGIGSGSQYAEVTIATLTGTNDQVGPAVFLQTGSVSGYIGFLSGTIGSIQSGQPIFKFVNGVATGLGPTVAYTPQLGDVVRLIVIPGSDGSNILRLYQNGFLLVEAQDYAASFTSGYPGANAFNSTAVADSQMSAWAGGHANQLPNYPSVSNWSQPYRDFVYKHGLI